MPNKIIEQKYLSLFPEGTKIALLSPEEAIDFIENKTEIAQSYFDILTRCCETNFWEDGLELSESLKVPNDILFIDGNLHINGSVNLEPLWKIYGGLIVKGNLSVEGTLSLGNEANSHTVIVFNNLTAQNLMVGGVLFIKGNAAVNYFTEGSYFEGSLVVEGKFSTKYYYTNKETYPTCNNPDGNTLTCIKLYNEKGFSFIDKVMREAYIDRNTLYEYLVAGKQILGVKLELLAHNEPNVLYEYLRTGKNIFRGNPEEYAYGKIFKNGCIK